MWAEHKRLRVQDLSWDRGPACPVTQEKMGRQGRGQDIHLPDCWEHSMQGSMEVQIAGMVGLLGSEDRGCHRSSKPRSGCPKEVVREMWKCRRGRK